jgi:hypothetical protein
LLAARPQIRAALAVTPLTVDARRGHALSGPARPEGRSGHAADRGTTDPAEAADAAEAVAAAHAGSARAEIAARAAAPDRAADSAAGSYSARAPQARASRGPTEDARRIEIGPAATGGERKRQDDDCEDDRTANSHRRSARARGHRHLPFKAVASRCTLAAVKRASKPIWKSAAERPIEALECAEFCVRVAFAAIEQTVRNRRGDRIVEMRRKLVIDLRIQSSILPQELDTRTQGGC